MFSDDESEFGEDEARRHIEIYGQELAAMAVAAITHKPDLDPPGAVVCEPGTDEGRSFIGRIEPGVPIRAVEGGICLAVVSCAELHGLIAAVAPGCESYLSHPEFSGPGRLPILAICKQGALMGVVEFAGVD